MAPVFSRIHVAATDNIVTWAENRVGEPGTIAEVACVPLQIGAVLRQAHLSGPARRLVEAGGTSDVIDARRPCGVVPLVVLRPKGLELKVADGEPGRRLEIGGHEPALLRHSSASGSA